jgi:hypothetical protein
MTLAEVHARRTDELRHDDALGAVDDERALVRHEREVTHEDGLALDLAGLVVHELGGDEQRRGVRDVAVLAVVDGVLRRLEAVVAEREAHGLREVLDRGDLLEDLLQTGLRGDVGAAGCKSGVDTFSPLLVTDQPCEAVGLQSEKLRDLEGFCNFGERDTAGLNRCGGGARGGQEGSFQGLAGGWLERSCSAHAKRPRSRGAFASRTTDGQDKASAKVQCNPGATPKQGRVLTIGSE